jgi:predicted MPP superfamily phosphohydrolase
LQLSGHTHAGQIFPFSILVKLAFPNICGYYNLGKGSSLIVSRGTGTWGPPVRFLASPEITIIEIVRK